MNSETSKGVTDKRINGDFPELGMEAVRKIYVENFPAFILVDDKGNDFFAQLKH